MWLEIGGVIKFFKQDSQISPISGSIKEQVVTFIGKEKIELYGKTYEVEHFKLTSRRYVYS